MANHTTIELTKKSIKLQLLVSRATTGVGMFLVWWSGAIAGNTTNFALTSWAIMIAGIVWSLRTYAARWWNHA